MNDIESLRARAEKAEAALREAWSLIEWLVFPAQGALMFRRCSVCGRSSDPSDTDKRSHESHCAILLALTKLAALASPSESAVGGSAQESCGPCSCGKMHVPNGTRGVMDFGSIRHRCDACVYVGNPEHGGEGVMVVEAVPVNAERTGGGRPAPQATSPSESAPPKDQGAGAAPPAAPLCEPMPEQERQSLWVWLEHWGKDGVPNWMDPAGLSVPCSKFVLRRLLAALAQPPAPQEVEWRVDARKLLASFDAQSQSKLMRVYPALFPPAEPSAPQAVAAPQVTQEQLSGKEQADGEIE